MESNSTNNRNHDLLSEILGFEEEQISPVQREWAMEQPRNHDSILSADISAGRVKSRPSETILETPVPAEYSQNQNWPQREAESTQKDSLKKDEKSVMRFLRGAKKFSQNVIDKAHGLRIPEFHKALHYVKDQDDMPKSQNQRDSMMISGREVLQGKSARIAASSPNCQAAPTLPPQRNRGDSGRELPGKQRQFNQKGLRSTQIASSNSNLNRNQSNSNLQINLKNTPNRQSESKQNIVLSGNRKQEQAKASAGEPEWRDIQSFVESWGLNIKQKNAFTKSEVIGFVKQIQNKLIELDQLTGYERQKATEYREENRLLNQQIDQQKVQMHEIKMEVQNATKEFKKHKELFGKLEECQQALKESMLNSLVCLDFYKDVESYVQLNKYDNAPEEVTRHFDVIEELVGRHGLDFMDFDTDKLQKLIDSIGEFIRIKEIEQKVIRVNLPDDGNKSEDDNQGSDTIKIKVTRAKGHQLQATQGAVGERAQSAGKDNQYAVRRHQFCGHTNQFSLKDELHQKHVQILKLKEQLECRVKRIMELKNELKREREVDSQKRKQEKVKDTITKLEKEYNTQVIRNTKQQLEIRNLKDENEKYMQSYAEARERLKQAQQEIEQFRKVLNDKSGFAALESTVVELSSMLVSKRNEQLNESQKVQLKAIFGNSAVLHKLRQRLQQLEDHSSKNEQMLASSVKLNLEFQDVIEDQWCLLRQVYLAFREIDEDQLHHYQLIMLQKQLGGKWTDEDIDAYEREFASKLVQLKELRQQISRESLVEKMSKGMTEDKDKVKLFSMMVGGDVSRLNLQKSSKLAMSMTPDRRSFKTFERKGCLTHEKDFKDFSQGVSESKVNLRQKPSEAQLYGLQNLTSIEMAEQSLLLGENTKDKSGDFHYMFEQANQDASQKRRSTLQGRFSKNKSCNPEQQLFRKDLLGKVPLSSMNVVKQTVNQQQQMRTPRNQQEDEDAMALLSQLDGTSILNDPQSTSHMNRPQVAKRVLRNRLKKLRDENTQLKATLQAMQDKLMGTSKYTTAAGGIGEGDMESLPSSETTLHKNMPEPMDHNLIQDISQGGYTGAKPHIYVTQHEEGVNSEDALSMLLMQAQLLESLIVAEE